MKADEEEEESLSVLIDGVKSGGSLRARQPCPKQAPIKLGVEFPSAILHLQCLNGLGRQSHNLHV